MASTLTPTCGSGPRPPAAASSVRDSNGSKRAGAAELFIIREAPAARRARARRQADAHCDRPKRRKPLTGSNNVFRGIGFSLSSGENDAALEPDTPERKGLKPVGASSAEEKKDCSRYGQFGRNCEKMTVTTVHNDHQNCPGSREPRWQRLRPTIYVGYDRTLRPRQP